MYCLPHACPFTCIACLLPTPPLPLYLYSLPTASPTLPLYLYNLPTAYPTPAPLPV